MTEQDKENIRIMAGSFLEQLGGMDDEATFIDGVNFTLNKVSPFEAPVMLNFAEVIEIAEQSLAQWKLHIEENEQKDITDISHWEALEWKKLNAKLQTNKSKISA